MQPSWKVSHIFTDSRQSTKTKAIVASHGGVSVYDLETLKVVAAECYEDKEILEFIPLENPKYILARGLVYGKIDEYWLYNMDLLMNREHYTAQTLFDHYIPHTRNQMDSRGMFRSWNQSTHAMDEYATWDQVEGKMPFWKPSDPPPQLVTQDDDDDEDDEDEEDEDEKRRPVEDRIGCPKSQASPCGKFIARWNHRDEQKPDLVMYDSEQVQLFTLPRDDYYLDMNNFGLLFFHDPQSNELLFLFNRIHGHLSVYDMQGKERKTSCEHYAFMQGAFLSQEKRYAICHVWYWHPTFAWFIVDLDRLLHDRHYVPCRCGFHQDWKVANEESRNLTPEGAYRIDPQTLKRTGELLNYSTFVS